MSDRKNLTAVYDYTLNKLTNSQKFSIATAATFLLILALIFNVAAFLAHFKRF